jgi:hypothetical protein
MPLHERYKCEPLHACMELGQHKRRHPSATRPQRKLCGVHVREIERGVHVNRGRGQQDVPRTFSCLADLQREVGVDRDKLHGKSHWHTQQFANSPVLVAMVTTLMRPLYSHPQTCLLPAADHADATPLLAPSDTATQRVSSRARQRSAAVRGAPCVCTAVRRLPCVCTAGWRGSKSACVRHTQPLRRAVPPIFTFPHHPLPAPVACRSVNLTLAAAHGRL